jgi:hypothetical protein
MSLIIAIRHQNLIGWDKFLLGYISQHWTISYDTLHDPLLSPPRVDWDCQLILAIFCLYKGIWDNRNSFLHGSSREDSRQKLRDRLIDQVKELYNNLPKLATRYPPIRFLPFDQRINNCNLHLSRWLSQIRHQILVSQTLRSDSLRAQQSILQYIQPRDGKDGGTSKFPL